MFTSEEHAVDFMTRHSLFRPLAGYYEEHGEYLLASDIYVLRLKNVPAAIEVLFHSPYDTDLVKHGSNLLMKELWSGLSFARKINRSAPSSILNRLLELAKLRISMVGVAYKESLRDEMEVSGMSCRRSHDLRLTAYNGRPICFSVSHLRIYSCSCASACVTGPMLARSTQQSCRWTMRSHTSQSIHSLTCYLSHTRLLFCGLSVATSRP